VISSKTKIIDFSGKYQVTLNTPSIPFPHQLEALPLALVTAVILTRCLAVSITYISNPLLVDASLSTYESNHKTRYAVSALMCSSWDRVLTLCICTYVSSLLLTIPLSICMCVQFYSFTLAYCTKLRLLTFSDKRFIIIISIGGRVGSGEA